MFYHLSIADTLISLTSVFIKSREKGLITKDLVTDTNLTFAYKWAVHFRTLAVKLFDSSTKLFQVKMYSTDMTFYQYSDNQYCTKR